MRILRFILVLIMMSVGVSTISAQQKINKVIREIERISGVNIIYSEKRNPQTRKLELISESITFYHGDMAAKLIKAFEAERENAVTYKTIDKSVYSITFADDSEKNTYEINFYLSSGTYFVSIKKRGSKSATYPNWNWRK